MILTTKSHFGHIKIDLSHIKRHFGDIKGHLNYIKSHLRKIKSHLNHIKSDIYIYRQESFLLYKKSFWRYKKSFWPHKKSSWTHKKSLLQNNKYYMYILDHGESFVSHIYGIRRSLSDVSSITEVKRRRARLIIGWVTAWDCQVLILSWGSENHVNQMARLPDLELDVKEPQWT